MPSININQDIKKFLSDDFEELLIICPFISLKGLKKIFSYIKTFDGKKINIVTRWRKLDVITGVSDIDIFPYLKKNKIDLFHHSSIHMKIFIKDKRLCLFGSANITLAGLGISKTPNIEVIGTEKTLSNEYKKFKNILEQSVEIEDKFYLKMKRLKEKNKTILKKINKIKSRDQEISEIFDFLKKGNAINIDEFIRLYF